MDYELPLRLTPQPEGGYTVTSPPLPELVTEDDTVAEALANAEAADRASAHGRRANRPRLRFASMTYALLCALRRLGLAHTRLAAATCGNLRLESLEIAAWVRIGVRRIEIAMDTNHPFQTSSAPREGDYPPPQPEAAHSSPFPSIGARGGGRGPVAGGVHRRDDELRRA